MAIPSKILLELVKPEHQAEFLAAVAASTHLHQPWVHPPASPELFRAFAVRMQGPCNLGFVVRLTRSRQLVGFVEVTNIVRGVFQSGYLGYYAFAGHERQGVMTLALRQLVKKAFSEVQLHRLEANIQPENLASVALVRACGFVQEGYSQRYLKIRGRWRDHERWAILAK
jgi:ribosomal-protein-alanine N-acetyltransferase